MSHEKDVESEVKKFVEKGIKNVKKLSAEELVKNAAINPFLVKALGIKSFDSLARFYVYQRVGRSLVTSFGTTIENMIISLSGGKKHGWWDNKAAVKDKTYYMSIKSGPRDMDKDQVERFAQKAKEIKKEDPNATPIIAMGYGKEPLGPIPKTLTDEGLSVKANTLTGKEIYDLIAGEKDYHKKLLELVSTAAGQALGGKKFINIIEDKVKEVAVVFKKKYKNIDELLLATF